MTSLLYSTTKRDDMILYRMNNTSLSKTERMALVMNDDPILNLPRELTRAEVDSINYTDMSSGKLLFMEAKVGGVVTELLFAQYLSPERMLDLDLGEKLREIQEIIADRKFQMFMNQTGVGEFDIAFQAETSGGAGIIRMNKFVLSKKPGAAEFKAKTRRLNKLLALVNNVVMTETSGEELREKHRRQWCVSASFGAGHEDNTTYSKVQLNITKLSDRGTDGLPKKGGKHLDIKDDPRRWTVVLFLSNSSGSHFLGRMNIYSVRATCPAATFGALVFSGRHPHGGSGCGPYQDTLPRNSNPRYKSPNHSDYPQKLPATFEEKRMNVLCYPNNVLAKARSNEINEYFTNEPDIEVMLAVFGTLRNWHEWKMRLHIRENIDIGDRSRRVALAMVWKFA